MVFQPKVDARDGGAPPGMPRNGGIWYFRRWRSCELADRFLVKIIDGLLAKTGNEGGRIGDTMTYLPGARDLH